MKLFCFCLGCIEIGVKDVEICTGNAIKKASAQLYHSLGLRDEQIIKTVQKKGFNTYANYSAAYNECAPSKLFWLKSVQNYVEYAQFIVDESQVLDRVDAFKEWAENFEVDENAEK